MGFASEWLNQKALFPEFINELPDDQTGIIVVIPAFNEASVTPLLNSLNSCTEPGCRSEVLIIVNAPGNASHESLMNNTACIQTAESWKKNNRSFFRLYIINAGQPPVKGWGVGLARKTGMDEALRRFNAAGKPEGVIVCLDADCTVEKNYFTAIYRELLLKKERKACSIYFEHPLSGTDFSERVYRYIIQYELHLRYFTQGLAFAGFPHACHTVGSALAVKALPYLRSGGMNRRQAGEDFYFVQKLTSTGGYFALNHTTVYPSPRESVRVPFGTGATISRLMTENGEQLFSYNCSSFTELKELFRIAPGLFAAGMKEIETYYEILPPGVRSFIERREWSSKVEEIQNNTSSKTTFMKRFYTWFNAFKIVKYLNHVHTRRFNKTAVTDSATDLLNIMGFDFSGSDPERLLLFYRSLDKGEVPG